MSTFAIIYSHNREIDVCMCVQAYCQGPSDRPERCAVSRGLRRHPEVEVGSVRGRQRRSISGVVQHV